MKVGDEVTIYEDPLTCQKAEGKGRLIQKLQDNGEMEYWCVAFLSGDRDQANRWIRKEAKGT